MSAALLIVLTLALISLGLFLTLAIGLAKGSLDLFRSVQKLAADSSPVTREITEGAQRAQTRMAEQQKRFLDVQETVQRGLGSRGRR